MDKPIVHAFELGMGILLLIFCIGFWLNQPFQAEHALGLFKSHNKAPQEVSRVNINGLVDKNIAALENYTGNQTVLKRILSGDELVCVLSYNGPGDGDSNENRNERLRNLDSHTVQKSEMIYYFNGETLGLSKDEVVSRIVKGASYYLTYELNQSSQIISITITLVDAKL